METYLLFCQDSPTESYGSPSSNKKKGKGGRKKNLYPPTPTIMKHRRNMANARERKRMNGLNDAFERLREVVPNVNTEQVDNLIPSLILSFFFTCGKHLFVEFL